MSLQPWRILFVCTGNAGWSLMAQALARQRLGGRALASHRSLWQ